MNTFVVVAVAVLNLFIAVTYCVMMVKKKSKPALAMWFFFSIAVGISLVTYLKEGDYHFFDNVLNFLDLFLTVFVTIAILVLGDKSTWFNKFDVGCLIAVLLIVFSWAIFQDHWMTNIAVQVIMVISYFPVVKRMLKSKENTEPFLVWIALMLAPIVSLLTSKGELAAIYAIRAIVCTGLLLALMIRIEWKKKSAMQLVPEELIVENEK
ncbi:MAG TPA: hypothetical protein PKH79_11420 [Prolixibacteraceae bacterium]|nr:hypothetical protein [Prolixibacteraceae bacterium]HPS12738.1 hypothetical protein [Prolixibacteraceae bacterium]